MTPEEARYAALRKFGNVTLIQEETRAVWIPRILEQLAQDVRYALRTMRRQPGFTVAVISMLAIGLGLVAGGYTAFNGLFLRGWAVPDSAQVFRAGAERAVAPSAGFVSDGFSVGAYRYIRAHAKAADYVALTIQHFRVRAVSGTGGTHTAGMFASENVIDALRIPLQLGSGFGHSSAMSGPRILISDRVWRLVFGADRQIVGRTAWLTGVATTIVGVTARGFDGLAERPLDVIVDMSSANAWASRSAATLSADGSACCVMLAGRIRHERTWPQVREELDRLTAQYRQSTGQPALSVTLASTAPMGRRASDVVKVVLSLIGAGLVLVLLLTCANVGNLYLARSLRRKSEIAVRLSLGASRERIVRQLLTEGLVMASTAGACAFVMTAAVPPVLRVLEDNITATMFASDWRVAAFTLSGVIVTCLLVSLAPALHTTQIAWRGATATMTAKTGRVPGLVLATQIAIAAVPVLSATLLARGIGHAVSAPADYALESTTAVTLEPPANESVDVRRAEHIRAALMRAIQEGALPVGLAGMLPADGGPTSVGLPQSDVAFRCKWVPLTASAFGVLGLRLVAGRLASDDPTAGEAVINETLARHIWPTESALGKTFTLHRNQRTYSIVGIARDAHLTSLSEVEPLVLVPPTAGLPVLLARTALGLEPRIMALVATIDPRLTVTLTPLSASATETLENARIGATIAAGLGAVALLLAIIGIFGVFSYLVEERRHEIGIRLALGASRGEVGAALLQASRGAVAGGLVAGLALSAIAGVVLRRFLFGLSPADPVSYAIVAIVLSAAAFVATAVPVRRALRVDPAITLKAE